MSKRDFHTEHAGVEGAAKRVKIKVVFVARDRSWTLQCAAAVKEALGKILKRRPERILRAIDAWAKQEGLAAVVRFVIPEALEAQLQQLEQSQQQLLDALSDIAESTRQYKAEIPQMYAAAVREGLPRNVIAARLQIEPVMLEQMLIEPESVARSIHLGTDRIFGGGPAKKRGGRRA